MNGPTTDLRDDAGSKALPDSPVSRDTHSMFRARSDPHGKGLEQLD